MRRFGMRCPWIPFAQCPVFDQIPLKWLKTPCLLKDTLQFGFLGGFVDARGWINFHFHPIVFHSFFAICLGIFLAEGEISLAIKFLGGKTTG